MRFVDLFAGIGGFHRALRGMGLDCVFASEKDPTLRRLYEENFPEMCGPVVGDIRDPSNRRLIPSHDLLCAGFPCQPFSKSGDQEGFSDKTRGTLFHDVHEIAREKRPRYIILENVGNFARHDDGRTWNIVKRSLQELGYSVQGTEHICDGGHGLVSPHHLGYPHHRKRFFVVASLGSLPKDPFPPRKTDWDVSVADIVEEDLAPEDAEATRLSSTQRRCIEHWNELLQSVPEEMEFPSAPVWGDEIDAAYPYERTTPSRIDLAKLRLCTDGRSNGHEPTRQQLLNELPNYAQSDKDRFAKWKRDYIKKNREWFDQVGPFLSDEWVERLSEFSQSRRKFEWNCKGEDRDLWKCVLQFRPSGLRATRYDTVPSLVSMTATQIPILGPEGRYMTRTEGLRVQGFPDSHKLPEARRDAFAALGNAVHVGVVLEIAERLLGKSPHYKPGDVAHETEIPA